MIRYALVTIALFSLVPDRAQAAITSTFDSGDEGWLAVGDVASSIPTWLSSGGNPGGTISVQDQAVGGIWYYSAPAKFLGDRSGAFGRQLSFDLWQTGSGPQFDASDVVLVGAGLTLTLDAGANPLPLGTWVGYAVTLDTFSNWVKVSDPTSLTGTAATAQDIANVLASLTALRIRGEFITGNDTGHLDNVRLGVVPVPAALWLLGSALGSLGLMRRRVACET